jgi:hypothetical protein
VGSHAPKRISMTILTVSGRRSGHPARSWTWPADYPPPLQGCPEGSRRFPSDRSGLRPPPPRPTAQPRREILGIVCPLWPWCHGGADVLSCRTQNAQSDSLFAWVYSSGLRIKARGQRHVLTKIGAARFKGRTWPTFFFQGLSSRLKRSPRWSAAVNNRYPMPSG